MPIRILVVEDESLVARDLEHMLISLGHSVAGIVTTGEEALKAARDKQPDLVLMDIVLKGKIDGIAAAERIWESWGIPVVYLTAYADDTIFQRAKLSEPFGYLLKPFESRELQTTIEMALYKSRMENRLREREQWLSTLLRSIGEGLIATDKTGNITFMNTPAEKLTGWSAKEAWQVPLENVFSPVEARPNDENALFPSGADLLEDERILTTRDGRRIPIERTIDPIIDNSGETVGQVITFRDISLRKKNEADIKDNRNKFRRALEGIIEVVSRTVETRDPYTAGHQRRVKQLAVAMSRDMNFSPETVQGIGLAGEIHDIGKICVPVEILTKPGQLTDLEYAILKTHPQVGYDILKDVEFPWPLAQIVLQHHERMDGSGYPSGLAGDDILPEARILIVADTVEAMSSHRPSRPAQGLEKALSQIEENRGKLYDADVVDSCLQIFRTGTFSFRE